MARVLRTRKPIGRDAFALAEVMVSMALFMGACAGLSVLEVSAARSSSAGAMMGKAVLVAQNLVEEVKAAGYAEAHKWSNAEGMIMRVSWTRRVLKDDPVEGVVRVEVSCAWACPGGRSGVVELAALVGE